LTRAVFVAAAVLVLVACGNTDIDSATTTSVGGPSSTTTGLEASTTSTGEPSLSDLTGTWENDALAITVTDQGEYVILSSATDDPAQALMGGFVARDGADFNFVTGTTGECPGQTGVYEATITADLLVLTLVEDPCEMRVSGFEAPLTRSG
jgi:hypothetical protein